MYVCARARVCVCVCPPHRKRVSRQGGADPGTTEGAHTLKVLQDGSRTELEYALDANNCLKDFKGTLLKAKGITVGLKLAVINDTNVLGWPAWMLDFKVQDPETQWPMTVVRGARALSFSQSFSHTTLRSLCGAGLQGMCEHDHAGHGF